MTDGCLHGQLVPGVWGASKTSIIFVIEKDEGILQVYKDKSLFVFCNSGTQIYFLTQNFFGNVMLPNKFAVPLEQSGQRYVFSSVFTPIRLPTPNNLKDF